MPASPLRKQKLLEDDIKGGEKMGCARRSVAVAVLVMMMMVGTSHSLMSNMSTSAATTDGNSTAASSAWCDGHMIDGQCMLIAHAYGGGEHLEYLNVDVMDMMEEGHSTRRILAPPITFTQRSGDKGKPVVKGDGRYGSPNQVKGKHCSTYKRTYCD